MTYSYLARVNRSSVCLYCLQYSGSFYFVYTPDSMLDIRWPTTPWSAYKLPEYVMQIPSDFRRWKTSGNGEHETRIYRENREVCVPKLPWSQKENVYPTSFAWNENSSTLLERCAILWSVFFKKVEFKNNFVTLNYIWKYYRKDFNLIWKLRAKKYSNFRYLFYATRTLSSIFIIIISN